LFFVRETAAQKALASPRDSVKGQVQGVSININYGSPSVKGREVWGRLVPYGQVWRAGANEATTVKIDKPVKVQGADLPAGKYSFFTIPQRDKWTVIFNKVPQQWGAFEYDEKEDALRIDVEPLKADSLYERLRYDIRGDKIFLKWEKLMIALPLSAKS